jgi:hypothetical protein
MRMTKGLKTFNTGCNDVRDNFLEGLIDRKISRIIAKNE